MLIVLIKLTNYAESSKVTDILEKAYKRPLETEQTLRDRVLTPLPHPFPSSTVDLLTPSLAYTSWQGLTKGRVPLLKTTLRERSGL